MEIMVFLMGFFLFCSAEIRHSKIRSDYHFIIPFKEFGFTHRGLLEIYVKDSSYKAIKENDIDLESMGFFLSARDVWLHVLQDLEHGEICCVLESKLITPLLTFKDLENSFPFNKNFKELEANQFTLVFANCMCDIVVSMDVTTVIYNIEGGGDGTRHYLLAGETLLSNLFFTVFDICCAGWGLDLRGDEKLSYDLPDPCIHGRPRPSEISKYPLGGRGQVFH